MSDLDFTTFKALVEDESQRPKGWRAGQTAFNGLYDLRPDLSERIRGHHVGLDPFYRDENLPAFWEFVEDQWNADGWEDDLRISVCADDCHASDDEFDAACLRLKEAFGDV